MSKTYLELIEGTSSKFWEIELQGSDYTVRYGRIGTDGRTSTKSFDSAEEAQTKADKAIESKRKKGYSEVVNANPTAELSSMEDLCEAYPDLDEVDGIDVVDHSTIYRGDVVLDDEGLIGLALEQGEEGTLVVIDGDLTCTADHVHWGDRNEFSNNVILVTGNLTVNNLELDEVGALLVQGNMHAKNIFVSYGDNGGSLDVYGHLKAEVFISTTYFVVEIKEQIDVKYIIGDGTYATDFAEGLKVIDLEENANVFVDEVIDEEVDANLVFERLVAGAPIFVNDGKPRDGAYDKAW